MTHPEILVRPMTSTDNDDVADLIASWRPTESFGMRQHYERYVLEAVAERDGLIVGWISYKIKDCNPEVLEEYEDSTEKWLYVVEIFTAPTIRLAGVGRALMRYAERQGRDACVRHSVLMPEADDAAPGGVRSDLMAFYTSLGYELMKPSPKHHPHSAPWLMGLEL